MCNENRDAFVFASLPQICRCAGEVEAEAQQSNIEHA
jgi:hypothetical protein